MGENDFKNEVEAEEGTGEMGSILAAGLARLLGSSISGDFDIV